MTHALHVPGIDRHAVASQPSLLDRIKHARERYAAYNRTYSELVRMTDRDLADIGIHRVQIHEIATAAADGAVSR